VAKKAEKEAAEKPVAKKAEKEAVAKPAAKPAPKKAEKEAEKPVQVAAPVQAKPTAAAAASAVEEGEEDEDDEPEIDVQLFKWDGVSYLLSADGVVYDRNTNEALGVWNAKENKIVFDGPESEDELCATEIMSESDGDGDDEVEFGDELDGVCSAMGACAIVAETTAM